MNLSQETRYRRRKPDGPVNGLPEPKVRPIILTVDDERKDLELVERELRKRYEAAYHVACEVSVGRDDLVKQGKTRIFSVVDLAIPPQRPPGA